MSLDLDATCVICNSPTRYRLSAPERMFGLGGEFSYGECSNCGMLSQINPPFDLARYYPSDNYYSFANAEAKRWHSFPPKRWLADRRNEAQLFGKPSWAKALARSHPSPGVTDVLKLLKHNDLSKGYELRILDVGCGGGELLCNFETVGFRKLEGVDLFICVPEIKVSRVRVRKISHLEIQNEEYDLILFGHSLEHMPNQVEAILKLQTLLCVDGVARIEVPVSDSEAFDSFGRDWIELDPPRHLYLHTRASLTMLAEQCKIKLIDLEEMGGTFEFWGSELYRRGLTLFDENHQMRTLEASFSAVEREDFKIRSASANKNCRGGRVAMYLQR